MAHARLIMMTSFSSPYLTSYLQICCRQAEPLVVYQAQLIPSLHGWDWRGASRGISFLSQRGLLSLAVETVQPVKSHAFIKVFINTFVHWGEMWKQSFRAWDSKLRSMSIYLILNQPMGSSQSLLSTQIAAAFLRWRSCSLPPVWSFQLELLGIEPGTTHSSTEPQIHLNQSSFFHSPLLHCIHVRLRVHTWSKASSAEQGFELGLPHSDHYIIWQVDKW